MLCWIFFLLVLHVEGIHAMNISNQTSAQGQKRSPAICPAAASATHKPAIAQNDAYGNDFDACMINRWTGTAAAGKHVLRTSPTASCSKDYHARLCYGIKTRRPDNAQYISCYNTASLIPEFTAHVVHYSTTSLAQKKKIIIKRKKKNNKKKKNNNKKKKNNNKKKKKKRTNFSEDKGPCAPKPQSVPEDCSKPPGAKGDYFCSRGHLTPNADFDTEDERDITFKMTNVAPQWQEFNGGNWAEVEKAVREYVKTKKTDLYVFTGTAGMGRYWQWGINWRFTSPTVKTVVPKYYWKAVCDPAAKQSIFFIAENNVRVTSNDTVESASCFNMRMTKKKGVVECESISEAAGQFIRNWWHGVVVPDFDPVNCGTGRKGEFLKPYLHFKYI